MSRQVLTDFGWVAVRSDVYRRLVSAHGEFAAHKLVNRIVHDKWCRGDKIDGQLVEINE